ncbi:MAG: nickel-dependent lactate racemase [Bacillota bacterium]|nr:nickel-dependent lactate racemase [Bacillota bacterium]
MTAVNFPYGKDFFKLELPDDRLNAVLVSNIHSYKPEGKPKELVKKAMASPYGSPALSELSKGKNKVVLIASDHTRPVPSKDIIPLMLSQIREGNPGADITILIATGCHRGTTKDELVSKFGEEIVKNEKIYIHDCDDESMLVNIGTLPSGGECLVNRLAAQADLLVSEGFIEPHFFAGFSGGRKSVLPGVCARKTVMANHCSEFIASEFARTGKLENNPIHRDMIWAARKVGLAYVVNVVINAEKEAIYAVAGDMEKAHEAGCSFLSGLCYVKASTADIAITTNGGYPLDQNVYQAVKGMTAAEATVKRGGVIIMLAKSGDGHGGKGFYDQMTEDSDIDKIMNTILKRDRSETVPDQWEAQVLIRVLQHARVIYISDAPDEMIENLHMIPSHSLEDALKLAEDFLNKENASITAIPDGVSVIVGE